jgi:hypothetical protein
LIFFIIFALALRVIVIIANPIANSQVYA